MCLFQESDPSRAEQIQFSYFYTFILRIMQDPGTPESTPESKVPLILIMSTHHVCRKSAGQPAMQERVIRTRAHSCPRFISYRICLIPVSAGPREE